MWIVIAGDPMDGFSYTGPFNSADEATRWAGMYIDKSYGWWLAQVETPVWAA